MHYTEVSALFLPQVALSSLGFPYECSRRTRARVCFCCVCTVQAFGCLCQGKDRLLLLIRNIFNCIVLIFFFVGGVCVLPSMDAVEYGLVYAERLALK